MKSDAFIIVGENIHCTRSLKRGGSRLTRADDGRDAVKFSIDGKPAVLPVPGNWGQLSADWEKGKCKHIALALYQAMTDGPDQSAGKAYLTHIAEQQVAAGATFLDVNVDEFSTEPSVSTEAMTFLATFLSGICDTPLSIDSSDPDRLAAGLSCCRRELGAPMVNSVSLEREDLVDVAVQFHAETIVSAAGRTGIPATADERLANLEELISKLTGAGLSQDQLHIDPLVLPISTDGANGKVFIETTERAAAAFPEIHLTGGLSNVSFGMPVRKLLNAVFICLCRDAGTDGGIIDPDAIDVAALAGIDRESKSFQLARDVLIGEDMFGMSYIGAFRDGRLQAIV